MSKLTVVQHGGVLVVDSRLIAQDLGIEHRSFVKTLDKYQSHIESGFGILRFEIAEIKGRGQPARFAWLTEDQATFVMTLSRNTERVVACKLKLVKAFSAAKQTIQTVIPAQQHEIEKLKLELELARTHERVAHANERLAVSTQMLALINPALPALAFGKPDAVVEVERPVTVLTDAYGRSERYDGATITELTKRYGFGKGRKANQQCREWLRSVGIRDEDWIEEPAAHVTKKLPRELMRRLDNHFYGGEGERQRNLGEGL
ncbi:MAG: Rha family transcriptional regulator [Leptolyngbya sp. SIO1D8]|nr:Rha family transcriptional regulator [Leptolyngbya sp. SIO1D8]